MKKILSLSLSLVLVFFLSSCSQKQDIYNKPALFWYKLIIKDIRNFDLEKADTHYTSMSSEHASSPLLEPALLILAQAHIDNEEYLLANFYYDTYIKRFGTIKKNEYAKYMKIKANFLSFSYPNRNQELILKTIKETKAYLDAYPKSIYVPLVRTILVKMQMGKYYLDKRISGLYKRIDKDESAKIYEEAVKNSSLKNANMTDPHVPWYRKIFD